MHISSFQSSEFTFQPLGECLCLIYTKNVSVRATFHKCHLNNYTRTNKRQKCDWEYIHMFTGSVKAKRTNNLTTTEVKSNYTSFQNRNSTWLLRLIQNIKKPFYSGTHTKNVREKRHTFQARPPYPLPQPSKQVPSPRWPFQPSPYRYQQNLFQPVLHLDEFSHEPTITMSKITNRQNFVHDSSAYIRL